MGSLLKEQLEYYRESLTTQEGMADFVIGTFVWGFLTVRYTEWFYGKILEFFGFLPSQFILEYVAYFIFGLAMFPLSFFISWCILKIFHAAKEVLS